MSVEAVQNSKWQWLISGGMHEELVLLNLALIIANEGQERDGHRHEMGSRGLWHCQASRRLVRRSQ